MQDGVEHGAFVGPGDQEEDVAGGVEHGKRQRDARANLVTRGGDHGVGKPVATQRLGIVFGKE